MNFRYFFITYYRPVCEPILTQQVTIDREWTGYSQMFVTLENSKIIGGYRSLNMGCKMQNKSLLATAIEARWMRNFLEE